MKKLVRLNVLGISQSQLQSGAYALILSEESGMRFIPVVIGAAEAQSIAIFLEGIRTPRPLTHDIFVSFAHAFGVKLKQVFINRFEDGIFSSELTFSDGERTVVIDARTSDAIAIAVRTGAPVFTTPEIVEAAGFVVEHDGVFIARRTDNKAEADDDAIDAYDDDDTADPYADRTGYQADPRPENYSIEQLEETLAELIDREDYEEAERINSILSRKKDALDNENN